MSNATAYAIAPMTGLDNLFEGDNTHPLAMSPAEEGRLAFWLGDSIEDNPYGDRIAWVEWNDSFRSEQCRSEVEPEEDEFVDWSMANLSF